MAFPDEAGRLVERVLTCGTEQLGTIVEFGPEPGPDALAGHGFPRLHDMHWQVAPIRLIGGPGEHHAAGVFGIDADHYGTLSVGTHHVSSR